MEKEQALPISGCKVFFPSGKKPFSNQFAMMSQTLTGISKSKNVLLESPTGSGKTLAILCSTLSWQIANAKHLESLHRNEEEISLECNISSKQNKSPRIPKVFFASRTHSQIDQVAKVLKTLPESLLNTLPLQSTILGSREQYCVNPKLTSKRKGARKLDKNEECNRMLAGSGGFNRKTGCQYFMGQSRLRSAMQRNPVWDIEELVEMGKSHRGCPFFVARELSNVNLVLCPYNYLIDPRIRNALDLDSHLRDAVVVIDEAHNIEGVCRDAASCEVELSQIDIVREQLSQVIEYGSDVLSKSCKELLIFVQSIREWVNASKKLPQKSWDGMQAIVMWFSEAFGETRDMESVVEELCEHFKNAKAESEQAEPGEVVLPPSPAQTVLDELLTTLRFISAGGGQYARDFKVLFSSKKGNQSGQQPHSSFITSEPSLCILCLNPAVAFQNLESISRSIILASGTLSPMDAFASELGVDFPCRFQGNHVINVQKQLFVAAIRNARGNRDEPQLLEATYKRSGHVPYQMALGRSLLMYLQQIPATGSLCFFPSYTLLNQCVTTWKSSSLWKALLNERKVVLVEPRRADAKFDKMLSKYRNAAQSGAGGSLFLCVFRGKLAEGIDFPDDNARVVFIIGIPFPSSHDDKVKLKREYQASKCASAKQMKLDKQMPLSGSEWYSQQAYRAVNQALGRCIRHRNDYGAIIFLDHRYGSELARSRLSKWVRASIRVFSHAHEVCTPLANFFKQMADFHPSKTTAQPQTAPTRKSSKLMNFLGSGDKSIPSATTFTAAIPGKRDNNCREPLTELLPNPIQRGRFSTAKREPQLLEYQSTTSATTTPANDCNVLPPTTPNDNTVRRPVQTCLADEESVESRSSQKRRSSTPADCRTMALARGPINVASEANESNPLSLKDMFRIGSAQHQFKGHDGQRPSRYLSKQKPAENVELRYSPTKNKHYENRKCEETQSTTLVTRSPSSTTDSRSFECSDTSLGLGYQVNEELVEFKTTTTRNNALASSRGLEEKTENVVRSQYFASNPKRRIVRPVAVQSSSTIAKAEIRVKQAAKRGHMLQTVKSEHVLQSQNSEQVMMQTEKNECVLQAQNSEQVLVQAEKIEGVLQTRNSEHLPPTTDERSRELPKENLFTLQNLVHTTDPVGLARHIVQQIKHHASNRLHGSSPDHQQLFYKQLLTGVAVEARNWLGENSCKPILDSVSFALGGNAHHQANEAEHNKRRRGITKTKSKRYRVAPPEFTPVKRASKGTFTLSTGGTISEDSDFEM